MLAFEWSAVGDALLYVSALVGAITIIVGAVRGVKAWIDPQHPDVTLVGPGAALGASHDPDTGRKVWDNVRPHYSIHNHEPRVIHNVSTGVQRRTGGERVTLRMAIPLIPAGERQRVAEDDFSLPPEWLRGYTGEEPHKQPLYWVRFRTHDGRWWEVTHDPADGIPHYRRLRRFRNSAP